MSFIITILAALLVFSAVIAIHEFGHFAVAKLCGIQVNEFSIGMGPVLWKKNHKGTQYSLRALPVGGFVALEGEESPESQQAEAVHTVQEQPAPETEASVQPTGIPLNEAPVWQRALVMVAGAFMNFVLGFVVLVLLALTLALTMRDCRRRKVNRWFDTLVFAAYALWGCVIFFLVLVSTHECTSPNYNALWLHPAYLLLAVLPWVAKARKVLTALHIINFVWLTASAVLLATGVLSQELLLSFYVLMAVPMVRSFNYLYIHRLCNHEVAK